MSGGHSYTEGTELGCIDEGSGLTCIVDANYICKAGKWDTKGSLPGPDPTPGQNPTTCTTTYAPVCGSQPLVCAAGHACSSKSYKTYTNRCQLDAAGATYESAGSCSTPTNQNALDIFNLLNNF